MSAMVELAERCEKATGHDLNLDHEIGRALSTNGNYGYRHYTDSLDAAMTLVPEGLKWGIGNPQDGYSYATMGGLERAVRAATPALALCAAALRARGADQ